jgi:phosphoribosylamine--glycine ligase
MKILVIGSGGREHALVWKIAQSPRVKKIFCAPGNAGIGALAACVAIKPNDIRALCDFAKREGIDLTVVGPEAPLAAGIVDLFEQEGLKIFGPSQKAAQLEASKVFSKGVMKDFNVSTAPFAVCATLDQVYTFSAPNNYHVVVKADGLAAGKGVVVCHSQKEVEAAAKSMLEDKVFGDAGESVVVEEILEGEEASILVLTNGIEALPLASSQDHKRVFDHDEGPNTGGMGAYSPAPVVTPELLDRVMKTIVCPVIDGMRDQGVIYRGVLYAGIMMTKAGPQTLEFNVRFGDPETQAVFPRLESDLVEAMLWTLGTGPAPLLKWSPKASVCVVMASGGYPGLYENAKVIEGLDKAAQVKDVVVFHAGTKMSSGAGRQGSEVCVTNGGRVLGVTGLGKEALAAVYRAVAAIRFEGAHFRKDIGWRALGVRPSSQEEFL